MAKGKEPRKVRRVTVRFTEKDWARLEALAGFHARGNVARYLREAALETGWRPLGKRKSPG